jgi:transcriptional regulator with XRE-family HTH domain
MTEKELHEIFSENVKRYRKKADLSQIELAKKTGFCLTFINDIELGRKWASPASMIKLANVFNIYAYELLKPPDLFPDNFNSIIEKFSDTVHEAVGHTRLSFLQKGESHIS